jgi:hypothetical protein
MMRAARLDVSLYEEVEADTTATSQALSVVVLVAVASALSAILSAAMQNTMSVIVGSVIFTIVSSLLGWAVWSYAVFFVGTRLFGGTATYGELLRTLGFASSPGVLRIFGFVPVVGGIIGLVLFVWLLVTGFVATRQALDIDNAKTIFTIIIAAIALLIVIAIISVIFGAVFGMGMVLGGAMGRP